MTEHITETHTTSATNYEYHTNTTTHSIIEDNQRVLGAEETSHLSDNMDDYEARLDARGGVSEHALIRINLANNSTRSHTMRRQPQARMRLPML